MIEEKSIMFNLPKKFGEKQKTIHWINELLSYKKHPLKKVLLEFSDDLGSFLLSSYIYFGMASEWKTSTNKIMIRRNVTIIHYHSKLDGPYLFSEMQNLESYKKIPSLSKLEIPLLSELVTKENVNLLACSNALTTKNLEFILSCKNILLCDEKGNGRDFR